MKILVNYFYDKKKDEFVILDNKYVLADQKVAIYDTDLDINKPLVIVINNAQGQSYATVVDRDSYEAVNAKFRLALDKDGNVVSDPNGAEFWLPKDTKVEDLIYKDGRLMKKEDVKDDEKDEQVVDKKPASKKPQLKK